MLKEFYISEIIILKQKHFQDIQNILDGAKNGVVYVNFGTNVQSSELPMEKKNAFLNVFRKLKEVVIWKWEESNLENKPDNVIIRKWLPQKEIFGMSSIVLYFIVTYFSLPFFIFTCLKTL